MGWKKKEPRGYTKNDIWNVSVTETLSIYDKPFLLPWAAKCTADYVDEHVWRAFVNGEDKIELAEILSAAKKSRFAITKQALQDGKDAREFARELNGTTGCCAKPQQFTGTTSHPDDRSLADGIPTAG